MKNVTKYRVWYVHYNGDAAVTTVYGVADLFKAFRYGWEL